VLRQYSDRRAYHVTKVEGKHWMRATIGAEDRALSIGEDA
jgi:hypothetical protein